MLDLRSPFDDRVLAQIPHDSPAGVEQKLAAAVKAQRAWRARPVPERVLAVRAGLEWFREHHEQVARDITDQMGKPIAQARGEVDGMLGRAEHMAAIAAQELAPDVFEGPGGAFRSIEHVPLGVVLDIAAWNYPLLIAVNVVVPALLAGNGVLLKHSARTPLCGQHFESAFADALPAGLLASLVVDHDTTTALIGDPRISHVSFTGSVEGGRRIHRVVAERFIDVGLELGGNDPAYVAADADLEQAVEGIVDGACYNAGQSCCAVERVFVHASLVDDFLERARALMGAYRIGDPMQAQTTLGPLADHGALSELERHVSEATSRGARLLTGGASEDGRFFHATLLGDVPLDTLVMREESFGPLLPVCAVADDDQALALMNDSRFGLTASIWTRDRERARWFAARHDAGTLYQNRCDVLDPALPWTGFRDSGKGSTLSPYGFLHLTRRKALNFKA